MRVVLGTVSLVAAVGWLALSVFATRFRESFGASAVAPLKLAGPPVGLCLVILSLLFPEFRLLLHLTAVLVGGTAAASLWVFPKAPFLGSLGLAYSALWFTFYAGVLRFGP